MSRLFPELTGALPTLPAHVQLPVAAALEPAAEAAPEPALEGVASFADGAESDTAAGEGAEAASADAMPPVIHVGGPEALGTFNQILGLPGRFVDDSGGCQVRTVKLHPDGHLAIDVEGGGVPGRTLWFWPKGRMPNPPISGLDFDIGIRGSTKEHIVGVLLAAVGRRLARAPLELLAEVVSQDSTGTVEYLETDAERTARKEAAKAPPRKKPPPDLQIPSLINGWGDTDNWRNFFADDAQRRNFCHNLSGSIATVTHEDQECHYATPAFGDGTVSFFNYPSVHDRYISNTSHDEESDGRVAGAVHLTTDLHDLDVIKGGTNKLDRALETLIGRDKELELVVVRATCVPVVIGDDMEASVEKFKKKSNIPVVFVNTKEDPFATPLRATYRAIRGDLAFKYPVKRPGSINLLGFPRIEEIRFLLSFLADLGVEINSRLLPDIDLKILSRYRAADLSVMADTLLYDRTFDEVFGELDTPVIRPAAPYGMAGSKNWLQEVANALGHSAKFDALWEEKAGHLERRFAELKREAAGYAVGFVVDSVSVAILLEPRRAAGVPILAMLREMGFAIDFVVYAGPDDPGAEATVTRLSEFAHSIQTFADRDTLARLLRTSRAQVFYSETFFDRRLTRSGKGQFSLAQAAMGADGAVATFERMLAVCKMPFYRRYSGYLGKPFAHLQEGAPAQVQEMA